jgi:hypothetical protein
MECAYYFASWNGIAFNRQPQAYIKQIFYIGHIIQISDTPPCKPNEDRARPVPSQRV